MQLFLQATMSTEHYLVSGLVALGAVVLNLYRTREQEKKRNDARHEKTASEHAAQYEKLAADHTKCLEQHAAADKKQGILECDVGHLREQLTFFREQSLRMIPATAAAAAITPPPSTPPSSNPSHPT